MNKIVLACVLFSLCMTGCNGGLSLAASTLTPTFTITPTITATVTSTPTPTEVPTPDPLDVNNYKIFEGNVQEKDKEGNWKEITVPYEAEYISYVEVHDGKLYGIDTVDRAVVVRNEAGEWEKFDRPMGIMSNHFPNYPDPTKFLEEVEVSQISRFNKDNKPLPWGIVQEETLYEGYSETREYISGYLLGAEYFKDGLADWVGAIFEVPLKYSRQILLLTIPADKGQGSEPFYLIPSSGNVEEMILKGITWHTIGKSFVYQEIRGEPMVYAVDINRCDSLYPSSNCSDEETLLLQAKEVEFIQSIKNGEAMTVLTRFSPQRVWFDESFIIE